MCKTVISLVKAAHNRICEHINTDTILMTSVNRLKTKSIYRCLFTFFTRAKKFKYVFRPSNLK